jgi:hypothetical protein
LLALISKTFCFYKDFTLIEGYNRLILKGRIG